MRLKSGTEQMGARTRIRHESVLIAGFICVPQPFYKFGILVLQLVRVGGSHFLNLLFKIICASGRFPQRIFRYIDTQGFNADIVNVVSFIEDNYAILR